MQGGGRAHRAHRTPLGLALAFIALDAACGGSTPHAEDATSVEREEPSELDRILADEPTSPLTRVSQRAFRPARDCSQGPDTVRFPSVGAALGESFEVHLCVRHSVRGDYRIRIEGRDASEPRSYGYGAAENARCVATDAERATQGAAATSVDPPPRPRRTPRGRRTAPSHPAAPPEPSPLVETDASFELCPPETYSVSVASSSFVSYELAPLPAGTDIAIELWSSEPNDLEGALFVVTQSAVPQGTSPESWMTYLDAHRAWIERYAAYVDGEVAAGRSHVIDRTATTTEPPPPAPLETPPPRPSAHATWVPGAWHHAEAWVFLPGFWRVPDSDVRAGLTVEAPRTPPPPRDEEPTRQPMTGALWTPGYWQWDGGTYVWVGGVWRLPPDARQRWQAPSWRATSTGAVFVPGGWTLTIGR